MWIKNKQTNNTKTAIYVCFWYYHPGVKGLLLCCRHLIHLWVKGLCSNSPTTHWLYLETQMHEVCDLFQLQADKRERERKRWLSGVCRKENSKNKQNRVGYWCKHWLSDCIWMIDCWMADCGVIDPAQECVDLPPERSSSPLTSFSGFNLLF